MLCDSEIKTLCIEFGVVDPFVESNLQPSSLDLTLGNEFIEHVGCYNEKKVIADNYLLYPFEFVLGTTVEKFNLPRYITATICGKSSVAREGLQVEAAGHVDPGFKGDITFEMLNLSEHVITVRAGDIIAQAVFHMHKSCAKDYREKGGHYQGQTGVTPSWRGAEIGYWK